MKQIPMTEHDIPLSAIVTPQEIIEIKSSLPRPKGIYWNMLPPEKIDGYSRTSKKTREILISPADWFHRHNLCIECPREVC